MRRTARTAVVAVALASAGPAQANAVTTCPATVMTIAVIGTAPANNPDSVVTTAGNSISVKVQNKDETCTGGSIRRSTSSATARPTRSRSPTAPRSRSTACSTTAPTRSASRAPRP